MYLKLSKVTGQAALREMSPVFTKATAEKLTAVNEETGMNLIEKGFDDLIFKPISQPGFLQAARAAIAEREVKLNAGKVRAALAAQAAAAAAGADADAAAAAGQAAADALKFLPDDVLDKVQRHEKTHGAHGPEVVADDDEAVPKKTRKSLKNKRVAAARAAEGGGDIVDREARPAVNIDYLKTLLKARGLSVSGNKAVLRARLDLAIAVDLAKGDGAAGAADVGAGADAGAAAGTVDDDGDGGADETGAAFVAGDGGADETGAAVVAERSLVDDDSGSDEEEEDADLSDAEPSVYFKQESVPEYLVAKLNDYAVQGKLRMPRATELITAVRASLSDIDALLLAYRPPLSSRAAEWRSKHSAFETALASSSPGVEIGKLLPFKL